MKKEIRIVLPEDLLGIAKKTGIVPAGYYTLSDNNSFSTAFYDGDETLEDIPPFCYFVEEHKLAENEVLFEY